MGFVGPLFCFLVCLQVLFMLQFEVFARMKYAIIIIVLEVEGFSARRSDAMAGVPEVCRWKSLE